MENGDITNNQITASSFYSEYFPWRGRLNNASCWVASKGYPAKPWIQVDLLHLTVVTGIITQGSEAFNVRATSLQIQYGDSENSLVFILENGIPKVVFCLFVYLFVYWSVCLFVCLFGCWIVCLFACLF